LTLRRSLIEWEKSPPSIRRQCELLSLHRSGLYYEPVKADADDLKLMRRIDEMHMAQPQFGSRTITTMLQRKGAKINRKHIQRLMRQMGIEGQAPGPSTSRPHPEHKIYPYLLRNLTVDRANQVWASDITYIPMARGFLYLVAIIDWYSRKVLSWRLSNSLDTHFCVEALNEALRRFGAPEIFNTDQGAQFTSEAFTQVLLKHDVRISMDGKGRCLDNVFVERLWRSLKYDEVYPRVYEDGWQARSRLGIYFRFFNHERPHQSLGKRTPDEIYAESCAQQNRRKKAA
jgi:putative transposase